MEQYTNQNENEQNSKLLKGIIIGGIIGGTLALLDSTTRSKVKNTAMEWKDSSAKMITDVKENPNEIKNQMISQFKSASNTLKEAINDAQKLYQRVNEDLFSNMDVVKEISNDAMNVAKDAKGELAAIGSKVKQAGAEAVENPLACVEKTADEDTDIHAGNAGTPYPLAETERQAPSYPEIKEERMK